MSTMTPAYRDLSELAQDAAKDVEEIPCSSLDALMTDSVLIDVREPAEIEEKGAIPDALQIPRGVLERDIAAMVFNGKVDAAALEQQIILYCGGGQRSLLAAKSLKEMGFQRVLSLKGGYKAYQS